jgi:hypothetical protein
MVAPAELAAADGTKVVDFEVEAVEALSGDDFD